MKRGTPSHIKTRRLMRAAGLDIIQACGALELLWHATARLTPRGEIGKYSDFEIEEEIGWRGEPGLLIRGFIEAGWIDKHPSHRLIVHDWHDHADDSVKKLLKRHGWEFVNLEGDVSGQILDMDPLPKPSHSHKPEPIHSQANPPAREPIPFPSQQLQPSELGIEGWSELSEAAAKAGMSFDPDPNSDLCQKVWRFRDFENKRNCIQGIWARIECGQYSREEAEFVPTLENYVRKNAWRATLRPKNRGQPKDKIQAASDVFDQFVMRDLEDAQHRQNIHKS